MSDTLLIATVLMVLAVAFSAYRRARERGQPRGVRSGPRPRLEDLVRRLMHSQQDGAFLIVGAGNSEDFLQMTGGPSGVQLDFPLLTDRQKSLDPRIRSVAAGQGLSIQENRGTDGSVFLDISIDGDAARIADACRRFMADVFGSAEEHFRYEHDGLDEQERDHSPR